MVGRGAVVRSSSIHVYLYIMCMYYGVVQGFVSQKKKGEGEDTGLCLVLHPLVLPQRRDCGLLTIFVALKDGPGFPWTLGAACGRVEPEPPALPSLKQERRQLSAVCGDCRGGRTTR